MKDEITQLTDKLIGLTVELSLGYAATLLLDLKQEGKGETIFSIMAECDWQIEFGDKKLGRKNYGDGDFSLKFSQLPKNMKASVVSIDLEQLTLSFELEQETKIIIGPPKKGTVGKEDFVIFDRRLGGKFVVNPESVTK